MLCIIRNEELIWISLIRSCPNELVVTTSPPPSIQRKHKRRRSKSYTGPYLIQAGYFRGRRYNVRRRDINES
jgi:hypothetical protein